MEVELLSICRGIGKGKAVATVDGEIAMEAEVMFAVGPQKISLRNV